MKRLITACLVVMTTLIFISGCATMPFTKGSADSDVQKSEPANYSQVPASLRGDVKKAESALRLARQNVDLAAEKVKLAELEKERGVLGSKYAGYNKELADTLTQKAEVILEGKKLEAIDNAGLGEKEENIKQIAKLKEKELDITKEEIKIKADIDTTALKLKELDKRIQEQSMVIAKTDGTKTKSQVHRKNSKK